MEGSTSIVIFAFKICTFNQRDEYIFLISIFDCFN